LVKAAFGRRGAEGPPIENLFRDITNNIFVISLNIHKIILYDSPENVLQGYLKSLVMAAEAPP
jgi:hypothetical protein